MFAPVTALLLEQQLLNDRKRLAHQYEDIASAVEEQSTATREIAVNVAPPVIRGAKLARPSSTRTISRMRLACSEGSERVRTHDSTMLRA